VKEIQRQSRWLVMVAVLIALSAFCIAKDAPRWIAIEGVTLIDGTGRAPVPDAVVLIQGDRIRAVGKRGAIRIPHHAELISARGKFLLPGLIDCHCHLEGVGLGDLGELPEEWATPGKLRELILDNARLELASGFTTVRDLGSTPLIFQVRDEINQGKEPGPQVWAAGQQLVKKSAGVNLDPIFLEYEGPENGRTQVQHLVEMGADVIKVRLTNQRPLPSLEELRAIVEEAHRLGRRVAVHTDVPADKAVQLAIDGGADGIEHNAPLRAGDQVLEEMAARHMFVIAGAGSFYVQRYQSANPLAMVDAPARQVFPPTVVSALEKAAVALGQQTGEMKKQGWDPGQVQARFARQMQRARQVGVLLGFGTDCGGELMIHGQQYKALYGETQMGSSAMEAILMATRDAAEILGLGKDLGTIEPGKLANLVIVDADPLADMHNLGRVHAVMKGGKLYRSAELIPPK
jgi:imidazolonepropionase-like amidohydrolase